MIWTDELLNQLALDAAYDINVQVPCIFHRFFLATTTNIPIYTLPSKVRSIKRITYRGIKLQAVSWIEMEALAPFAAWVDGVDNNDPSRGVPRFYALHPTNIHDLRLYPTPTDTYNTVGDPYSPVPAEPKCTITCWRNFDPEDESAQLPAYVDRRMRKAYTLWQAFKKEGKGQDATASLFYKKKYSLLIDMFKLINSGVFVSKRYRLGPGSTDPQRGRPAKPQLPATFERVRFR